MSTYRISLATTFLAATLASSAALGQCELQKMTSPQGELGTFFGDAVALAPGLAAIGQTAPGASGLLSAGAVYIYMRASGGWAETQRLQASDGQAGDLFGCALAIDGERMIIGAYGEDSLDQNSGAVYVFELQGGTWIETAKLQPSQDLQFSGFGRELDLSGDRIIVGAGQADVSGLASAGGAYLFERQAGVWNEVVYLNAAVPEESAWFGGSVAIAGDVAIIGEYEDGSLNAGSAHVYEYQLGSWVRTAGLIGSDTRAWDLFGFSVDVEGERCIVGAPDHDIDVTDTDTYAAGAVYVFEKQGGNWIETAKLIEPVITFGSWLGGALSLEGDRIAAGARGHVSGIDGEGSVHLFEKRAGAWVAFAQLTASDAQYADFLGTNVALSGDTVLTASPWIDTAQSTGAAYLFDVYGCGPGAPFCYGSGCPCGNDDPVAGCANSTGTGASLQTAGSASLSAADLRLDASGLPAGKAALILQGSPIVDVGTPFGDGLSCISGGFLRLELLMADGAGMASSSIDIGAAGGVMPGDSRIYQLWYRDPSGPCGTGFNFSNAYWLTYVQ